jgi:hypothetical protein
VVYHADPVVVNNGELCLASGYESLCVMLSQLLWVMMCNAEQEVMNPGVL